ncbi:helix-turn-helix transcriptional regulator [Streptomyces sp. DSM 44915]|uniref:Helix-turn-helix transcriptional regulator n=1 Tax=Streptomyces chisholmiae TaxID=3075540 RepID=A0ABU2JXX8_9ACTN|nr:helix-turn-helix transcriptional regulator [Streptomyces sp. DSM 44915]MDT0269819.1 helix-turn-helix transcriptional regulator [Streptomyces sp. DSM 44915]
MENQPADALAARLRALKERSGQSFGSLARRLHTSTSTLHRYCSGAVVPADYPAVERLARACGAEPAELLELHRLWLLADSARGRAAGRGEPRPAPDGAQDLAALASAAPAEPVPATSPAAPAEPVASAAPAAPAEPVPATASATPAPEPGPAPAGPGPVPAGRRRWRRRLPLVAALLLALGAGGYGVARADWFDRAEPSAGDRPAAAGDHRPPGDPAAGGEVAPATVPTPLEFTARSHVWAGGCDHRYLVDADPATVPPPPVAQDAEEWSAALDAVHGDSTIVEATVRATGAESVVVEALHVRVVARRAPLTWDAFDMSVGCGGALTPAAYQVGLDAERPQLRPVDGYDAMSERELVAPRTPFAVTADEPLALRIEATAAACDCDWYLELEWSSGTERGTLRVDDHGAPFRTSGGGSAEALVYREEQGEWARG